jgi:hypothetical protein
MKNSSAKSVLWVNPNCNEAQRQRILQRLRIGPVTTIQIREELDVLHPCGRVKELRKEGYDISMVWINGVTACGVSHRVGRYELHSEPAE